MAIQRAVLLIADIGGYTRFMKVHQVNLAHAQDVVARLLEAVIDAAALPFKLSKLEGDAALFYAPIKESDSKSMAQVASLVADIRRGFLDCREDIAMNRVCTCDSCMQAGQLKIKFVAHVGDIALQKVKGLTELAGVDVIVVHRMLKNDVPISEYVLMTDALHNLMPESVKQQTKPLEHDFEGIGKVMTHYADLSQTEPYVPKVTKAGFLGRMAGIVGMNLRVLPYMLHLKKPCDGFRNMDQVGDSAVTSEHSASVT